MLLKTFLQPGSGVHLNVSTLLLFDLFDMGFWACRQFHVSDLAYGVAVWERQGMNGSRKLNLCPRKGIFKSKLRHGSRRMGGKKLVLPFSGSYLSGLKTSVRAVTSCLHTMTGNITKKSCLTIDL